MDKKKGTQEALCLTRRDFIVASSGLAISAAFAGCGGGDEGSNSVAAAKADPTAKGTPWAKTNKVVDLIDSLHMADVDHHGEFIDFGTAGRYKSTLGGWMSGWGNDTSMNGVAYTWATKSPSRLYFTMDKSQPLTVVVRAKAGGTSSFGVWMNDKSGQRITLTSQWKEHRIDIEAEKVLAGENYLKFIYSTAEKTLAGMPASFQVDYLRIIPAGANTTSRGFEPPHLADLKQTFKAGDRERSSLIVSAPTTLSYYAKIPAGASLCFGAAMAGEKVSKADIKVKATAVDGAAPVELVSKTIAQAKWSDEMIDLSKVAGKLAKIDIIVKGDAGTRVALGDPAVRVTPPKTEANQPKIKNAIVVLVDTLRADKLTSYGKTRVRTPKFEKFAKESTLFENCQAPSNWTKPSCASVLTGLYPDTHKARGHSSKLPASVKMGSELFRQAGFSTGAFIANGYLAADFGFNRGWNKYVNFIRENKNTDAENVYKVGLEFIEKNKDKPFFTYIQTIDPHVPYDPPSEDLKIYDAQTYEGPVQNRSTGNLLEEFKRKKVELGSRDRKHLEALYDGEITYHDRHFGHFLDSLKKMGVLDNTAIIVCSDHGEEFFEHESVGHGHTLHQELLHVPLAIRAPNVVPANTRLKTEAGLSDILPTLLEATGVGIPKGMEGRNLLSVANGDNQDPMDAAFSSFYSEADERNLSWSVRQGDFKMRMKGPAVTYVYNLADDPKERTDVDTKYPLALRALRISLGQFIGAPDKTAWSSDKIAANVVGKMKAKEESAEVNDDLKQQLRALGYMQ